MANSHTKGIAMLPRTIAAMFAALLLSACAMRGPNVAPAPQNTVTPTETPMPATLPSDAELATWVLTSPELDYVNYTAYTLNVYIDVQSSRTNDYVAAVDDYRADPSLLTNNAWRAKLKAHASGLTELSYFFQREAPSERFMPILARTERIALLLQGIDQRATAALDGDSTGFDDADKLVEELKQEVAGVEAVFDAMLGK